MSGREDWTRIGDARLHLVEAGEGMPCVFQHGLGGDGAQAEQNFPDATGFRRLTLECRAHGRSEPGSQRPFSIAMFAEDVMEGARRAGAGRFVAGGVSMGAAIALRLAVTQPETVAALILVRPAWVAEPGPANMRPYAIAADAMRRHPREGQAARAEFADSTQARHLATDSPDNLASLLGFFDRPDLVSTADLLSQIAGDGPGVARDRIEALRLPTLVAGSRDDDVHPLRFAEELAALIPGARLAVVPPKGEDKAAHQAAVRREIAAFLASLPPSAFEGTSR